MRRIAELEEEQLRARTLSERLAGPGQLLGGPLWLAPGPRSPALLDLLCAGDLLHAAI